MTLKRGDLSPKVNWAENVEKEDPVESKVTPGLSKS